MITLHYTREFLKDSKKLPNSIKLRLAEQLERLSKNPFDPKLHTKLLRGKLAGLYSFRITREWRVIFHFEDLENIKLLGVGHRKEIYRKK